MKILFVNAVRSGEGSESFEPPLGIGYLSSYLKSKFKDLEIKFSEGKYQDLINDFRPNVVGISSTSPNFDIAIRIAKTAKMNGALVIVGGSHISMLPKTLDKNMDIGVMGEGEETFYEIISLIKKYGKKANFSNVKSIIFRNNKGDIVVTEKRDLIADIDRLPFPDRSIFKDHTKTKIMSMFSSRGCPYKCAFCSSTRFWRTVRFNSAEYVIKEIKFLIKNYKPKHIILLDDLFIANKNRLREIISVITKEKINEKITFSLHVRSDLIDEETCMLLKQMNVEAVFLGVESGSDKILKEMKPSVSVEINRNAIKLLRKHKILINSYFIIGFPNETKENIMETYNFIKENNIDFFAVFLLAPLPGTPIWDAAIKRGLVSEKMDWAKLSSSFKAKDLDNRIILCEKIKKDELVRLYNKLNRLCKIRKIRQYIRLGIRHPYRVIIFLKKIIARVCIHE